MKVTVLLTSYNAGKYLPRAIESVKEQTYTNWELVILDDGSTDPLALATLDAAEQDGFSVIRFSPTPEEREATARYATNINYGINVTDGDAISYLAGDDYYFPTRLERMVQKLLEGHDCVYGPQLLLGEGGNVLGLRPTNGRLDDAWCLVDMNSVVHTRAAIMKAGGWNDNRCHWTDADGQAWRRMHEVGYTFMPVDGEEPTDAKHYRATSVTHNILANREPWFEDDAAQVITAPDWLVGVLREG
jgi:glycosyltransferase involved in cell wall biosynthesis